MTRTAQASDELPDPAETGDLQLGISPVGSQYGRVIRPMGIPLCYKGEVRDVSEPSWLSQFLGKTADLRQSRRGDITQGYAL